MRLLIFGAEGRLGSELTEQALARGHQVGAFVREPAALTRLPEGLDVRTGDVLDADAVDASVLAYDAVISAFTGMEPTQAFPAHSDGMRIILSVMQKRGLTRVVAVGGAGVLDSTPGILRGDLPGYPPTLRNVNSEHRRVLEQLRKSGLEWTLVCVPNMTPGSATHQYRVAIDLLPEGGLQIAAGDVAAFILQAVEQSSYACRRVGLAH